MDALWPIITIVGPLILAAAVLWALMRNRATAASRDAGDARADAGARRIYAEEDAASRD